MEDKIMHIYVAIIDKATHQIIETKSLHFEQAMPLDYVLAGYMGQTLWELSFDPKYYVQVTKDDTTWEQETL